MTPAVRVALLGCGRIARHFHLPVLADDPRCALAGLGESDADALAAASDRAPEATPYASWEDALERTALDAVVIALPSALHAEVAIAAFERGLHVYVEKPLALDVDGAEAVAAAWRRAGTVGVVGHAFRRSPLVAATRALLDDGALGEVVAVRAAVASAPRTLPGWKRARATGGGALHDLAVHALDLVPVLLDDPVVRVAGVERNLAGEGDVVALALELASGTPMSLTASLASRQEDRVELLGTRATVRFDRYRDRAPVLLPVAEDMGRRARLTRGLTAARQVARDVLGVLVPPPEPSFARSIGAFLAAAGGESADGLAADPDDGVRVARLVAAAAEAAATGRSVTLAAS